MTTRATANSAMNTHIIATLSGEEVFGAVRESVGEGVVMGEELEVGVEESGEGEGEGKGEGEREGVGEVEGDVGEGENTEEEGLELPTRAGEG